MFYFLEKRSWIAWLFTIIIAAAIFYISSLTFKPGIPVLTTSSFFYHFLAFFWLSFFLLIAVIKGRKKNLFLPAILLILVYAVSDEFHQLFVPGRVSTFQDFLTDSAGIFLASFLYILTFRKDY